MYLLSNSFACCHIHCKSFCLNIIKMYLILNWIFFFGILVQRSVYQETLPNEHEDQDTDYNNNQQDYRDGHCYPQVDIWNIYKHHHHHCHHHHCFLFYFHYTICKYSEINRKQFWDSSIRVTNSSIKQTETCKLSHAKDLLYKKINIFCLFICW